MHRMHLSSEGVLLDWRDNLLPCWTKTTMCKTHRGVQLDWSHRAGRDRLRCIYAGTPKVLCMSHKALAATASELVHQRFFLIIFISFQQRYV